MPESDTTLVYQYLERSSAVGDTQDVMGERVKVSQSTISTWLEKKARNEQIEIRKNVTRQAIEDYLHRPGTPFSEGMAYAILEMRSFLNALERRRGFDRAARSDFLRSEAEALADTARNERARQQSATPTEYPPSDHGSDTTDQNQAESR